MAIITIGLERTQEIHGNTRRYYAWEFTWVNRGKGWTPVRKRCLEAYGKDSVYAETQCRLLAARCSRYYSGITHATACYSPSKFGHRSVVPVSESVGKAIDKVYREWLDNEIGGQ